MNSTSILCPVTPAKEDVIQSTDCSQCRENREDLANSSGTACGNISLPVFKSCSSGPETRVIGPNFSAAFRGLNWITPSKAGVQEPQVRCWSPWVPAFAGMTTEGRWVLSVKFLPLGPSSTVQSVLCRANGPCTGHN